MTGTIRVFALRAPRRGAQIRSRRLGHCGVLDWLFADGPDWPVQFQPAHALTPWTLMVAAAQLGETRNGPQFLASLAVEPSSPWIALVGNCVQIGGKSAQVRGGGRPSRRGVREEGQDQAGVQLE